MLEKVSIKQTMPYSKFMQVAELHNINYVEPIVILNIHYITNSDLPSAIAKSFYVVEFIEESKYQADKVISEEKSEEEKQLEIDLNTILNKDPFGGTWNGKTLKEIFDAHDEQWILMAKDKMINTFIRDKINNIINSGYAKEWLKL